jgi:hypothetical protein
MEFKANMSIGSIFLGLALFILVALFVSRPLIKRQPRRRSNTSAYEALLAQKEAILTQILNLDFDFDTGKVPESEYKKLRADYMSEATAIIRQLDALETGEEIVDSKSDKTEGETTKSQTDEIEAAIALLRQSPAKSAPSLSSSAPDLKTYNGNGKAIYCTQCGQLADSTDKFCAFCGHKLPQPQHI